MLIPQSDIWILMVRKWYLRKHQKSFRGSKPYSGNFLRKKNRLRNHNFIILAVDKRCDEYKFCRRYRIY